MKVRGSSVLLAAVETEYQSNSEAPSALSSQCDTGKLLGCVLVCVDADKVLRACWVDGAAAVGAPMGIAAFNVAGSTARLSGAIIINKKGTPKTIAPR